MVVIIGDATEEDINFAAKVAGRYSKGREEEKLDVIYGRYGKPYNKSIKVKPAVEEELSRYLIV